MDRKFGFPFFWKRATGFDGAKARLHPQNRDSADREWPATQDRSHRHGPGVPHCGIPAGIDAVRGQLR